MLTSSYAGSDGSVTYQWMPPVLNSYNNLGSVHIVANLNGSSLVVDSPLTFDIYGPGLQFKGVQTLNTPGSASLSFSSGSGNMTVLLNQTLAGKMLSISLQADQPWLSAVYFALQPANPVSTTSLAVPYYSHSPLFLPATNLFLDGFFDFQNSSATLLNPGQALYQRLTNGRVNTLNEKLILAISENLGDVFPSINNPPSPYLSSLAGRTVFDIWGQQNFTQIAQTLALLSDYGVRNCVVLIHGWQTNGFDNTLPLTYPASSSQGGNSILAQAISTGKAMNCFMGLHENYADYYSNYPQFTSGAVALNANGSLNVSWVNPSTQIQSFATKPNWFVANAATQAPQIHAGLGTNASFLDVNSASPPWFRVDMDATQSGAGMLSTSFNASKSLWNFQRQTHGGPVFGEGLYHWYSSGLLDGVEAQFGAGTAPLAENSPLFVDFDLLKIHPLQVNHGMGMYERWLAPGESITQTNLLDAYRMQEIIFGHAPYLENQLWTSVSRALLEQNLVGPVAARYGTQPVKSISYYVNGAWTSSTAAITAGNWSQVQVVYENGDTLTANALPTPLTAGVLSIPQYGWTARGQGLLAYTAQIGGLIGDYSQTATSVFANARNQSDLANSGSVAVPAIVVANPKSPGLFGSAIQWKVLDGTNGVNMIPFIHFVDSTGAVAFQIFDNPAIPSSQWKPGQVITDAPFTGLPSSVADGTYSMRIGMYSPASNVRYQLAGVDDGSMRYILGNLTVSNGGQTLAFTPQPAPVPPADPRLNSGGVVMNFGTIRTDGMVSMQQNQSSWNLSAYPRYRNVTVQLSTLQFPKPSTVMCDSQPVAPAESHVPGYWQLNTNGAKSCQW